MPLFRADQKPTSIASPIIFKEKRNPKSEASSPIMALKSKDQYNDNILAKVKPSSLILSNTNSINDSVKDELLQYIRENLIGAESILKVIYCDYVASGKSLRFIEEFLFNEVLPEYANTHTTTTRTSSQTTHFRAEAKQLFRKAVNAQEDDVVIMYSSGSTGAVHKLIHNLSLEQPPKESTIALREGRKLVACLAAASNVTGIISNVDQITALVHRYSGFIFWDYATGAPYMPMDMNPDVAGPDKDYVYKDAIYFSMHKFVGGPQTPGILIAKKGIFKAGEKFPDGTGGGTVAFVTHSRQFYSPEVESREEGGTPGIVESIRAGMVIQLKEAITSEYIMMKEEHIVRRAWNRLSSCPNLIILGGSKANRLPIFSFLIRHRMPPQSVPSTGSSGSASRGGSIDELTVKRDLLIRPASKELNSNTPGFPHVLFLHHNYVVALLNDLFGIQCRGGCVCAGPYAMDLLGINDSLARLYENVVVQTPGFARINLAYFATEAEHDFILDAICFVATHGWKLLPLYQFNVQTSVWKYRDSDSMSDQKNLFDISYTSGVMSWRRPQFASRGHAPETYDMILKNALNHVEGVRMAILKGNINLGNLSDSDVLDHNLERVRWFLLPSEAAAEILGEAIPTRSFSLPLNIHSPWHPGTIERCFCPDMALVDAENLIYSSTGNAFYNHGRGDTFETRHIYKQGQVGKGQLDWHLDWKGSGKPKQDNGYHGKNDMGNLPDSCLQEAKINDSLGVIQSAMQDSKLWCQPSKELFKPFLQAVRLFDMFRPGDRVLVCLSGGKNSISLLHCLRQYQLLESRGETHHNPFTISAITVDPGNRRYNPRPLIPYLQDLGVPYHYEEQDMLSNVANVPSYCSRMKRGTIYAVAKRYGYNVIALAQNLDDIAASFLMSLFHNGVIQTMEASVKLQQGDLRVVRPFVFAREHYIENFVEAARLPVVTNPCPLCQEAGREQERVKRLLIDEEHLHPRLFDSISAAMIPLLRLHKNSSGVDISTVPSSSVASTPSEESRPIYKTNGTSSSHQNHVMTPKNDRHERRDQLMGSNGGGVNIPKLKSAFDFN